MTKGIYLIRNNINGKLYIGSSKNIKNRWMDHKARLRAKTHRNDYLQKSWHKYGEDNFEFEIIEKCSLVKLEERELHFITLFKTFKRKFGYNLSTKTGRQLILDEEVLEKKSKSTKKQWKNKQTRKKMLQGIKKSWKNNPTRAIGAKKSGIKRRDNRSVIKLDMQENILEKYNNRREAFLKNGKNRNIYKVLEGKIKSTNSYIYIYTS
jgi:group I intron endonuclease